MNASEDPRLERLLGGEGLARLRQRLRKRYEQAAGDSAPELIYIADLTPEEHRALASLTGRPQRLSASIRVDIARLDAAFREAGIAVSLRDALERLDGPIVHAASLRRQVQDRWAQVMAGVREPRLSQRLREVPGLALLKRLARQDAGAAVLLCREAELVLARLPAHGITRAQLAAETLGSAHGLDNGRPLATLVLAVLRTPASSAVTDDGTEPDAEAIARSATERVREQWAAAGVMVNELARPALTLNLPMLGAAAAGDGEPRFASLRLLLRATPAWNVAGRDVYVCENPNVVAIAADRLGARCAPLVCTEGMPAAAQRTLLGQLAEAGARLRYHGDFDWPGLAIANHVLRTHGAIPWRFAAKDYLAALVEARQLPLAGTPVVASWDARLTETMDRRGLAVPEEAVTARLLEDLRLE